MPCHLAPLLRAKLEWIGENALLMKTAPATSSSAVGNYFMLAAKNKVHDISSDFPFRLVSSELSATLRKGWQGIGSPLADMAQLRPACCAMPLMPFLLLQPGATVAGPAAAYRIPEMNQQREMSRTMWSRYQSHFKT